MTWHFPHDITSRRIYTTEAGGLKGRIQVGFPGASPFLASPEATVRSVTGSRQQPSLCSAHIWSSASSKKNILSDFQCLSSKWQGLTPRQDLLGASECPQANSSHGPFAPTGFCPGKSAPELRGLTLPRPRHKPGTRAIVPAGAARRRALLSQEVPAGQVPDMSVTHSKQMLSEASSLSKGT